MTTTPAAQAQLEQAGQTLLDAIFAEERLITPEVKAIIDKIRSGAYDDGALYEELKAATGGTTTNLVEYMMESMEAAMRLRVARSTYISIRRLTEQVNS